MEFDATFLISLISFIVFIFIMNKILYAPVLEIMNKRQHFVDENFNTARNTKHQTMDKIKIHDTELENTRDEARSIVAKESKRIKQEHSKIITDYKSEVFENISKEKENLKASAFEAKEILKDNIVDIAKNISGIILGDNINSETINKSQIKED